MLTIPNLALRRRPGACGDLHRAFHLEFYPLVALVPSSPIEACKAEEFILDAENGQGPAGEPRSGQKMRRSMAECQHWTLSAPKSTPFLGMDPVVSAERRRQSWGIAIGRTAVPSCFLAAALRYPTPILCLESRSSTPAHLPHGSVIQGRTLRSRGRSKSPERHFRTIDSTRPLGSGPTVPEIE